MKLDNGQRNETPAETVAKPPPRTADERGYRLFQTKEELRRHGSAAGTKDRLLHAAAALAGGSRLVAALFAVILFLE